MPFLRFNCFKFNVLSTGRHKLIVHSLFNYVLKRHGASWYPDREFMKQFDGPVMYPACVPDPKWIVILCYDL